MILASLKAGRSRLRSATAGDQAQSGFTLVELLVAMTLLTAILAGSSTLLIGMMTKQPDLSDRSEQVETARVALERMVRELRPGYAIDSATGTSNSVTFRTYMRRTCQGGVSATNQLCRVTYTCTAATRICTRSTANPDGTGATAPIRLITGVSNSDVFTVTSTHVDVKFVMPSQDGRGATTIVDGATLRNATLAY